MLWYIIDGWNVAHKVKELKRSSLMYEELVYFIIRNGLTGSKNNRVTIVFDGNCSTEERRWPNNVNVIFSGEESADEVICRKVSRSKRKNHIVVVSNDRKIRDYVRMHGVSVKRVEEFLARSIKDKTRAISSGKSISYRLQREITEELKKIWLGEDE